MELLVKKQLGQVTYCNIQKIYFIEFGNILFKFAKDKLIQFCNYVNKVDYEYWLKQNKDCFNTRKLLLDCGAKQCGFALHVSELKELSELLNDTIQKIENHNVTIHFRGLCLN